MPLSESDKLSIPVAVNQGLPPSMASWPSRELLTSAKPQESVPRADTSWREIIHAAVTAGKPLELPHAFDGPSAFSELMIRLHSLCSTLGKGLDDDGIPALKPSAWTTCSADPSERRAASYRLGMTLAHWLWGYHLGHFGTHHVDVKFKNDVKIRGKGNQKSADLYGWTSGPPRVPWLLEAKASILAPRVQPGTREHAWKQLRAAEKRGWELPHGQMLVSATAVPLLHLVVDVALPPGSSDSPFSIPENSTPRRRPARADIPEIVAAYIVERFLLETALDYLPVVQSGRLRTVGDSRIVDIPHLDLAVGLREPAWHDLLNPSETYHELKASYRSTVNHGVALKDFVETHVAERLPRESDEDMDFWEAVVIGNNDFKLDLVEDDLYRFVISDPAGVVVMLGRSWATEAEA
ncbi:hypothetical protein AB0F72_34975 [Actinoplanes sp. NPDC023936]|uniref:hypothetical protein n=1 Tax=Actinoplanes sp. NPDC023936 TaxID=3154910 RepID=UPI0033E4386A